MKLFLSLLALGLQTHVAQDMVWAILRPDAEVRGQRLRLEDIADVGGTDSARIAAARRLDLGATPPADETVVLTSRSISDLVGPSGVTVRGQPRTVVRSASMTLTGSDVAMLVEREIANDLGASAKDARVVVPTSAESLAFVPGRYATDLRVVRRGPVGSTTSFVLEVVADGEVIASRSVPVRIETLRTVLIATRDLMPGRPIEAEAFVESQILTTLPGATAADLAGRKPLQRIAKGSVLRTDLMEKPIALRRNDPVTILVESGSLSVRAEGTALADAAVGSIISVRTKDQRRTIQGEVLDSRTVRVAMKESRP